MIQGLYKISLSGSTLQERRQARKILLEEKGKKRQARGIENVEEIDFSKSSRKAFSLLKHLGNRQQSETKKTVDDNAFTSRLMETSKISKGEKELKKRNKWIRGRVACAESQQRDPQR